MISLKNKKMLDALPNHTDKEYALVEEEKRIYQYHEESDSWEPVGAGTEINTGMTLYEVNQAVVNKLEPLDEYVLSAKEVLIKDFIKNSKNKYYMLLCNELHYYTVFVTGLLNPPKENAPIQREITTCLFKMGTVKSIEETPDKNAIEIWVTTDEDKSSHMFYLFPYDEGVIECE